MFKCLIMIPLSLILSMFISFDNDLHLGIEPGDQFSQSTQINIPQKEFLSCSEVSFIAQQEIPAESNLSNVCEKIVLIDDDCYYLMYKYKNGSHVSPAECIYINSQTGELYLEEEIEKSSINFETISLIEAFEQIEKLQKDDCENCKFRWEGITKINGRPKYHIRKIYDTETHQATLMWYGVDIITGDVEEISI